MLNRGMLMPRFRICLIGSICNRAKMTEQNQSDESEYRTIDPELSDLPITLGNLPRFMVLLPIKAYQKTLSKALPPNTCRFYPTCSQYAIDALRLHGPFTGIMISTGRILRCRPGGTHGYDPVPRFIFRRYRGGGSPLRRAPECNRLKDHD